jgi:8-oxo-dGTP diphosphatase
MEEKDTNDSVVIVVTEKHKILLIQRSKTDEWMPLHWSFPGGHIEKGETPYKAAKRELKEETELDGKVTYAGTRKTKNGKMYIYLCDDFKGDVKLNYEHSDHKWIEYKYLDDLDNKTPFVKEIIATALQIPMGYE